MKKRITAVLLMAAILVSLCAGIAGAADSAEDALGEINIYNGDYKMSYLAMNGVVRSQKYTYYKYTNAKGEVKEIPAYCINPTTKGVPQSVAAGESIKYMASEASSDPKIVGIISNGYPRYSASELGLEGAYHCYYATKMALWCYLIDDWDINRLTVNPALTGEEKERGERILAAAKRIYTRGITWTNVPQSNIVITADKDTAYAVTIDGKAYKQQVFTLTSDSYVLNNSVAVSFTMPDEVPDGTRIVDMNNQDIASITTEASSGKHAGKFKILYPAESVEGKSGSVQLSFHSYVGKYAVFYALCAETDKYGNLQRYMCDTDPMTAVRQSVFSQYSASTSSDTPDTPTETTLIIEKVETGTMTPLAGALFEVKAPDGTVFGSFASDDKGRVMLPLTHSGQYVITEKSAPTWHLIGDEPTKTVVINYGETKTVTFANAPYGNLHVNKVDADSGKYLPGAEVEIKHIETGVTYTGKTDLAGSVYFEKLQPGAYQIRELAAPAGWIKDTQTYTVTVPAGDEAGFTLKNQAKPGLTIIKYDEQTHELLADVTFEVFRDTERLGEYTTNEFGEINLVDLQPGTYLVREKSTAAGYVLDSTPQEIELKAGDGIKELVFFNLVKPGIHITKVDGADMSPLPNTKFRVSLVGGTFSGEYTTDGDGEIDLSGLEPGSYTVEEITATNGYLPDDSLRVIQIKAGENARFIFTNSIKPTLNVVKLSADGSRLAGVTFRIAKIEDGSHYFDRTTDARGEISISDLEPGVYSIKETATDSSHILDVREYHMELFPGKTSTLTVENQKRPNLIVYKYDADTGEPIANTVFEVRAADGHSVDQIKTDSEGKAELKNLLPGVYEITEKSVPSPYLLDAPSQLVTLYPNRDHTVYFENHKKPSLTVKKVDSVTGDALQGAKFRVTYASNNTVSGEINDLGTFYTDENGQFQITGLRDGWYKVTELEPPTGYAIKESTQEVYIQSGTGKTLTFENIPLSALVVWKYDSVTGEAVPDAVFQVKYLTGTSGTVIGTYKTSANGSFTVTGLREGTYIVEELASDSGHVIDTAPQTAYISGKEQDVVQLYFGNSPKGALLVKKIDSVTHAPLSDVEFMVTTADGTVVGNANGKYVTDSAGSFAVEGITPGTTLVVRETRAKAGYVLDDTPQTAKILAGQTVTLEFRNTPIGGLIITKSDESSGKRLSGVQFEVRKTNGEIIGTYTTDLGGVIQLPQLDSGWYTVTELKTVSGYQLDTTPQQVEVKDGQTATVALTNRKTSNILLHKVDADTGEGIYGATFLLYDSNHNPIGQYTTDQNGYIYMDEGLADGSYYIREIQAADGYILDTQLKTIYVQYGAISEITWENTAVRGQIQIIKKSANENPINGLPAGTLLEGAVFEVYDKAGNKVDTIRTDRSGRAVSKLLPLSRYTIREVSAPAYYAVNPTVMTAYLEYEGQIVTFEVLDSSVATGVSITKTGPKEVMPGQPIRYTLKDIANTSTVPLSSFYWRDTLPGQMTLSQIVTGTYNQQLSYKVVYKTNLSGTSYRTLADNLSTSKNYVLDARPAILKLASNERITEVMFVFGQVKAGFAQVETPALSGTVAKGLSGGSSLVNVADVGGLYNGQWIQAVSRTLTGVYAKTMVTLPKTGY
ncbi:MAG: SpaA isopeptide-forming pilin-related protein [Candidatus Pseudoscilispira sp.]|nr:SpaA isopeptide-forming pilin-related protein [Candidatus Pseudoscilispira sp.]